MATLQDVADIVIAGKAKKTPGVVQEALDAGLDARDILNTMIDAMSVVGELSSMVSGRALTLAALSGVDVTPPQLIVGENIKNVPHEGPSMKSFTLPFSLQPAGTLSLVLSFDGAKG